MSVHVFKLWRELAGGIEKRSSTRLENRLTSSDIEWRWT
jgi:hypothetical protein